MPPESWAYEPGVTKYPNDLSRAKALLDGAGYRDTDGDGPATRFELTFTTSNIGMAPAIAQIVQEQLRNIGVGIRLEQFERNTFFDRLNQGTFDMYYARSVGGNQTPDVFQWAYHARYSNPALDQLATKLRAATDAASVPAEIAQMLSILEKKEYCPSAEVDRLLAEARAADPATARSRLLQAYDLVAARGAGNRGRYCNPALNEIILRAERSPDRAEQKTLFSQIQRTVSQEVPQVYLWYPANVVVARKRVGNINIDLSGAWYFVKDVTLQI
jgi:ABC-type transport system substrate-binding protein